MGTADKIFYRDGYKYQLAADYCLQTGIYPPADIRTDFIALSAAGELTVSRGYAWDGPSGPTVDTPDFMRGSLVHDALYQLMREGLLDPQWRDAADGLLEKICLADGMPLARARYVYRALVVAGGPAADPRNNKPVLTAP